MSSPIKSEINPIMYYMHCPRCLNSDDPHQRKMSGRLAVGVTKENFLQIFCEECGETVYQGKTKFK